MPSLTRGFALAASTNLYNALTALLMAPILARSLGADGRGVSAAAIAPLTLLGTVAALGLPEALTHFVARGVLRSRQLRLTMLWLATCALVATVVVVSTASLLAGGDAAAASYIRLAILALAPTLLLAGARAVAMGRQDWKRVAAERLMGTTLRVVAVVTFAVTGHLTVATSVLCLALTPLVGGLAYLRMPMRLPTERTPRTPPLAQRTVWGFALASWGGALVGVLLLRLDQLLVLPLSDATQLGLYVVAVSVAEVILLVNSALRDVLFAVDSGDPRVERLQRAGRLSNLATFMLGILVAANATWVVPLVFGAEFRASTVMIAVLVAGIVLGNPGSIAGIAVSARGRPLLRTASIAAGLLVNVLALVLLVPTFGGLGAAWATLLGNVTAGGLNLVVFRRLTGAPVTGFLRVSMSDVSGLAALARHSLRTRAG